jgi:hypothetical protein
MVQGLIGMLTIFVIFVISYFINKKIRGPYCNNDVEDDDMEILGDDVEVNQSESVEMVDTIEIEDTTTEGPIIKGGDIEDETIEETEVVTESETVTKEKSEETKKYTPKRRARKPYKKSTKHKKD